MAQDNVDVMLRLRNARRFQADAKASGLSLEGIGKKASDAGGKVQESGRKMSGFGRTLSRSVTLPLAAVGAGAVKLAMDFEKQMSSLGAVTDATAPVMGRFRAQALKAGADTAFSAKQAATAQIELAKGGVSTANILSGALNAALGLAAAGELELGEAAEITANAMNLFGLRGRDATRVADQMATAANATTADVADFGMALKQGGSVAKSAGLSFTDTMVALEALAASGIKNSDAGTSLKAALIQLLKPSAKQAALTKELGLNFLDAGGNMKSLSGISAMLRTKLGGMTKAQRTAALATLAGTDGVRTLTSLYDAGPKKLDRFRKGLEKQGTAADIAKKKQKNLRGQLEQLRGSAETLGIVVGTAIVPPLTALAKRLTGLINGFQGLSRTQKTVIGSVVLFVAAVGPMLYIFGKIALAVGTLVKVFVFLKKAFMLARLGWALLNAGLLISPIGLIVVGVVALAAAFYVAYKKVGWFRKGVQGVFGWIKANWPLVLVMLTGPVGIAVAVIIKNWDRIKRGASSMVGYVKGRIGALVGFFKSLPGRIGGAFSGMFDGLKSAFRSAVNFIIRGWNSLEFKIPGFDPPGPGPKFGGVTVGVPNIPELASGGVVRSAGLSLVGERGPEMLSLPRAASVVPLPAQGPAPSFAGAQVAGGDNYFTVQIGSEQLPAVVAKETDRKRNRR